MPVSTECAVALLSFRYPSITLHSGTYLYSPHMAVLPPPEFHALRSESVTLFKAASEKVIQDVAMCANILKQTCEIIMFIQERGFLHNGLKSNNVMDGSENKPAIVEFGKSCKIVKARLRKPKVNIEKTMNKFPHIAPEMHRGERQSIFVRLSGRSFI